LNLNFFLEDEPQNMTCAGLSRDMLAHNVDGIYNIVRIRIA